MADRARSEPRWIEPLSAILLSVAGLATAWATYQSALWSGAQAHHYAEGGIQVTDATRLELQVGQASQTDYMLFQSWLQAAALNQTDLMTFYERRFRPEFARAFAGWRKQYPGDIRKFKPGPGAAHQPQPVVDYAERAEADRLRKDALASYRAGDEANAIDDRFVAVTVIFSTVLFLAGIASVLKRFPIRAAVLVFASFLCAGALAFMLTLPTEKL